jgi:hypothetical protein
MFYFITARLKNDKKELRFLGFVKSGYDFLPSLAERGRGEVGGTSKKRRKDTPVPLLPTHFFILICVNYIDLCKNNMCIHF